MGLNFEEQFEQIDPEPALDQIRDRLSALKEYVDTGLDTKADSDGGGAAELTNYGAVETADASIGGRNYPLENYTSVTVAADGTGDYSTIQAAIDDAPLAPQDLYEILVADGDYSTEDLLIPPYLGQDDNVSNPVSGYGRPNGRILLRGNPTTPSNVKIGSMCVGATSGLFECSGVQFQRPTPYRGRADPYNAMIVCYNTNEAWLKNLQFATYDTAGIMAYSALVEVRDSDLSGVRHGVVSKRESNVTVHHCTGVTDESPYNSINGSRLAVYSDGASSADSPVMSAGSGGFAFNPDIPSARIAPQNPASPDEEVSLLPVHEFYRLDDFGDSDISNREDQIRTSYPPMGMAAGRFRPDWSVSAGTSITGDTLSVPAGESAETHTHFDTGRWSVGLQFATEPTTSEMSIDLFRESSNDKINLRFAATGDVQLRKRVAGTYTVLISTTISSYTDYHSVDVERAVTPAGATWKLWIDDDMIGTAQDDYFPAIGVQDKFDFDNFTDAGLYVDRVRIGSSR